MNLRFFDTDRKRANSKRTAILCAAAASWLSFASAADSQTTNTESKLRWFDAMELCVEGKGWMDTQHLYDRLPAKAEGMVRPPVWGLSHDSAGIAVRCVTDATAISVRWTVRKESLAMSHMPASGVSGVDLYVRHEGDWRWLGAARPEKSVTTEKALVSGLTPERRECLLYLPLYNGVDKVEIGVPAEAKCEPPLSRPKNLKPIVFYGTSILQGGCASRPGMAYPAILGRRLDWPTINLGFSGNAQSEPEMAALLAELDPAVFVLDPLPNMRPEWVTERMSAFVAKLREAHPRTPIVLVEHGGVGNARVLGSHQAGYTKSNASLRQLFEQRRRAGDRKLFYVRGGKLLGEDGQGTVDGVHATDLGFMRMADAIEPTLKRALQAAK
jgi:lysophospholipase L1-like esterase